MFLIDRNRGHCYFFGHLSLSTSMWQTIDLSTGLSPWIDRNIVKYRLSAWLGGWLGQNDHAKLLVTFSNRTKHPISPPSQIDPVLARDRNFTTSMIYRQINGTVPIYTRFATILVELTHDSMVWNDACVDNISLELFL